MEQIVPFAFEPLMTEEELTEHEGTIAKGKQAFIFVGKALQEINERRGYRFTHGTFAEYVEQRWGMSISSGYDVMKAAQVTENVQTSGQIGFSQAVAIGRLEPELQKKFVAEHDVENMSARETQEAIRKWKEAERRAEEAERQLAKAKQESATTNEQAKSIMDRDKTLLSKWESEVIRGIEERLDPVKQSLEIELQKKIEQKYKGDIKLLESTNAKLAERSKKLEELEQSHVWEAASARNEVTRIMNVIYAQANKGFAEIETQYLEKLSPDINTVPILNHIAEQFIEMGTRIHSWLQPKQNKPYVIEGDYSDIS